MSSYCCPARGSCAATASIVPSCDTADIPVQITPGDVGVTSGFPVSIATRVSRGPGSSAARVVIRTDAPSGNHDGYDGLPTESARGTRRRFDPSAASTQREDDPSPRWSTPSNAICSVADGDVRSQFDRVVDVSPATRNWAGVPCRMRVFQSVQYPDVAAPPQPVPISQWLNSAVVPSGEKRGQ